MGGLIAAKAALFLRVPRLRFEKYRERSESHSGRQLAAGKKEGEQMQMALSESLSLLWGKTEPEEERKLKTENEHIPLERAYLCQDCESVGNNSKKCPACASTVLMGLASVLNREHVYTANVW